MLYILLAFCESAQWSFYASSNQFFWLLRIPISHTELLLDIVSQHNRVRERPGVLRNLQYREGTISKESLAHLVH